jgi:hypothetical protein
MGMGMGSGHGHGTAFLGAEVMIPFSGLGG